MTAFVLLCLPFQSLSIKIFLKLPKNSIPSSLEHPKFKSTLNSILSKNNYCTKKNLSTSACVTDILAKYGEILH